MATTPAPGQPLSDRPLFGILLLLCALLCFTCLDTTTKYLTATYNVPVIVAMRYIVNCALMVLLLAPRNGRALMHTERTGLVLLRSALLAAASLFVALALKRMPVAETTALIFLAPMLVMLLARPVLGERIGILGWVAALGGFAGVLLIARPGSGLDAAGVLFALVVAAVNAAYQLLSRVLARSERTIAMLFYSALAGSILFGLALPFFWEDVPASRFHIMLLLSLGVSGGLGHYFFTAAFRYAPASLLAPAGYLQLLFAGLLGWVVFGHVPDGLAMLGMLIIAVSGVTLALKSRSTLVAARPAKR